MWKIFRLFSTLTLVFNQILVISGGYEPLQSPKKGFILDSRVGPYMLMKIGNNRIQIDQSMYESCDPRALFGFKFFEYQLNELPKCPFPDVPPLIEQTYKNISVSAGQKIRFDVVFTGYPKPVVTFFKSDIQLIPNPRVQLSDSLLIEKAVLEDSGVYTMVAQNPIGSDEIDFFVQVDPPAITPPPNACPPKVTAFMDSNIILNDSYLLVWYKVNVPAIEYKVELFDNTTKSWRQLAIVPENTLVIRSLKCYLSYRFRVISLANGCESEPTESKIVTVLVGVAEAIPNPLTIAELLADKITITWNPSNNECGSPVSEYSIEKQYLNSSEWRPNGRIAANSRQFTDTNIVGTYRYGIKAINGFGESVPFISTFINPFQLIPKCSKKPEGELQVVGVTRDSVHLKWGEFKSILDKNVTFTNQIYKIESGSQEWQTLANISNTEFVVNQLKCHTEYRFRVQVFTSNCETATLESKPILTPGVPEPPPTPVNAVLLDAKRLNMSWTLPPVVCDAPIQSFTIERQYNNSEDWNFVTYSRHNYFLDTNIAQTFRYRIRSTNNYGSSEPMISRFLTPRDMIPLCPKKAQGIVAVDSVTRDSVHLKWDQCILEKVGKSYVFQIEMSDSSSNIWLPLGTTAHYQSSINRLKCHTEYRFRIKVFTLNCETVTLESKPVTTSGLPETPQRPISVIVLDKEKLNLNWTAPPVVCNAPIEGYIIEKQYNSSEAWFYVAKTAENRLQEFNIGQTYRYRIRTINRYGESIPLISNFVTPYDKLAKATCPKKADGDMQVVAVTRESVHLKWLDNIPDKKYNSIFEIGFVESGSDVWVFVGKTSAYQVLINQLKCHTEYRFRIKIVTPECGTVIIESKPVLTLGAPDPPPRPIHVIVLNRQMLNMSWIPTQVVCDTPILRYTITKQYNNSEVLYSVGQTAETTILDSNIGQTFRYRITATNRYGESLPLISKDITPYDMLNKQ